ncbi:MAG: Ada metal-binding domain-containing protein [Chitinophagaceae bacterium]
MIAHADVSDTYLRSLIKQQVIIFGGNRKLKIYGTLQCASGKRMKRQNRVFFHSAKEADDNNYRPCGHCMKTGYKKWKDGFIQ